MLRIHNLVVSLTDDRPLSLILKNLTSLPLDEFPQWRVVHRSIDARKKDRITLVYTIDIEAPDREAQLQRMLKKGCQSVILPYEKPFAIQIGSQKLKNRPVIIGMGPAGLFAALHLARQGYRPLIFEKGKSVEKRSLDVANFWNGSEKLFSHSNVQFGEGGAGTFSDGKLTSRSKNPKVAKILADFVKAGAPEDILYHHKPHVGTDVLRKVLINLRKELESLGAEIFFEEECNHFLIQDGMLSGITTSTGREVTSDALILACGHSSRSIYRLLHQQKVTLESKPFAVGFRIEHPQEWLDQAQYGKFAGHPKLGSADYMLTHNSASGRGVYTFCMCPGGEVVASASEVDGVVVNGMSFRSRSSGIANSAVVATVTPEDWNSELLGGIDFQETYEKLAFKLGGGSHYAPIQRVGQFITGTASEAQLITPTYRPGVTETDLRLALPSSIIGSLQEGLQSFGRKIPGFDHPGAILTGVETRTSAPVRITRSCSGESISCEGLYPTGEGAGYAGGIISAALDGINQAEKIMEKYRPLD